MDELTLQVGERRRALNGAELDLTAPVTFRGEALGSLTAETDGIRRERWSLFRTEDGRLVLYTAKTSQQMHEPSLYALKTLQPEDLQPGGAYALLGQRCGLWSAMTLDQALEAQR